jgi:hypothetical protein
VVTTLAGLRWRTGGSSGSADGTERAARFIILTAWRWTAPATSMWRTLTTTRSGKSTPTGVVTTLAGLPANSGSADGTGSAARFAGPYGVAVDSAANVYVADEITHDPESDAGGVVTTLAGLAAVRQRGRDGKRRAVRFSHGPGGGQRGQRLCGRHGNNTIRKVTRREW